MEGIRRFSLSLAPLPPFGRLVFRLTLTIVAHWKNLLLIVLCAGISARTEAQANDIPLTPSWPPAADGLSPAPEWVWGRLDNGLRYVVRRNSLPAGHISLRFAVEVGFAHESPTERGLAHFVEHMAFNGTTHFPGETLVPELRRRGVNIGPELSAFTFLTHTLYNLDAPAVAPEDLQRWFTVLRDFADGMQFDAKQVKRERGVIVSEFRDRQSPDERTDAARRRFLYPRSPLSTQFSGEVNTINQKTLRAFYNTWYRPDRMILVAVGDVDPAQLEALVQQHFSSLRARTPEPPRFNPGTIGSHPTGATFFNEDKRYANLRLELTSVLPKTADSFDERRRWTARYLALQILNGRLQQVVRKHPSRFVGLSAFSGSPTPYNTEVSIAFAADSSEWKTGIATLEQELRSSLDYPFTADEIREARTGAMIAAEQEVKSSATIPSAQLAAHAVGNALWNFASTSPEDNLRRTREWLPEIDAAEINREWRSLWPQQRPIIFASGRLPAAGTRAEDAINDAFNQSQEQSLTAAEERADLAFAYTDFGPPGVVSKRDYVPELDLHLLQFSNGVSVNLKRTTFEASTVYLTTRFGRGMMSEPADQLGLASLTSWTYPNGGLGRHTAEELRRILSSSSLSLSFSCEGDAFVFNGYSSSTSLERLLELLTADLIDPAWTQEAVALAATQLNTHYYNLAYTPEGVLSLNVFRTLSGGDSRYTAPTLDQFKNRTLEEVKQWLSPQLASAPLELGLVGDFDVEATIEALSRTVGTLPARNLPAADERPLTLSKVASTHRFKFQGEAQRAGLQIIWPVEGCRDSKLARQVEVMTAIFESRLNQKVREDLGAAYAPSVSFWKSDVNLNDGYIMAYISVKPRQAKRISQLMIQIADSLSRSGATADEFEQARTPILSRAAVEQKENGYWLSHVIPRAQSQPDVRERPLTRLRDLQAMTLTEINAVARSVLPASHAISFSAVPGRQ